MKWKGTDGKSVDRITAEVDTMSQMLHLAAGTTVVGSISMLKNNLFNFAHFVKQ